VGACVLVARGAGRPLLSLLPPLIFLLCALLVASPSVLPLYAPADPDTCGAKGSIILGGLGLAAAFSLCTCGTRVASYAGLGFGAGAALGWSICAIFIVDAPVLPTVLRTLLFGLIGAVLLPRAMPISVKQRALKNNPNHAVTVELPYAVADLFYELLDPTTPLGAASGQYSATATTTVRGGASPPSRRAPNAPPSSPPA